MSGCAGDAGESARGVPESDDVNALVVLLEPVNDAIGTANHFPQIRLLKFRHGAADFGKVRDIFGMSYQFVTQPGCRIGIMLGDIADNIGHISLCRRAMIIFQPIGRSSL